MKFISVYYISINKFGFVSEYWLFKFKFGLNIVMRKNIN